MTTPKVSKAQMEVLRRLATGDSVTYQFNNHYLFDNGDRANPATVRALKDRQLIYRSGVDKKHMPRYAITDTGRALVEQEAEKVKP